MVKIFQPGWRQFDLAIVQMFVLMLAHTHFSANLWSIHFLMCKYLRKFFYPKLIRHLVFLHSIFTDNFGHFWWLILISIWTSWNVLELNQQWFCLKPIISLMESGKISLFSKLSSIGFFDWQSCIIILWLQQWTYKWSICHKFVTLTCWNYC